MIAKINTKMKIKVVNNIPNNRLKFICAINISVNPSHIEVTSATSQPRVILGMQLLISDIPEIMINDNDNNPQ